MKNLTRNLTDDNNGTYCSLMNTMHKFYQDATNNKCTALTTKVVPKMKYAVYMGAEKKWYRCVTQSVDEDEVKVSKELRLRRPVERNRFPQSGSVKGTPFFSRGKSSFIRCYFAGFTEGCGTLGNGKK